MFSRCFAMCLVIILGLVSAKPIWAADGKITGTITIAGKPLAEGRIIFHLPGDQFVGTKVKNGQYIVNRVPVGTHKITIEGTGVPAKYSTEEASPLTVEVKEGKATNDLNLQ